MVKIYFTFVFTGNVFGNLFFVEPPRFVVLSDGSRLECMEFVLEKSSMLIEEKDENPWACSKMKKKTIYWDWIAITPSTPPPLDSQFDSFSYTEYDNAKVEGRTFNCFEELVWKHDQSRSNSNGFVAVRKRGNRYNCVDIMNTRIKVNG